MEKVSVDEHVVQMERIVQAKKWRDDPKRPGWRYQTDENGKKLYIPRPPYLPPITNKFDPKANAFRPEVHGYQSTPAQKTTVWGAVALTVVVVVAIKVDL